jgi:hypothetical protein
MRNGIYKPRETYKVQLSVAPLNSIWEKNWMRNKGFATVDLYSIQRDLNPLLGLTLTPTEFETGLREIEGRFVDSSTRERFMVLGYNELGDMRVDKPYFNGSVTVGMLGLVLPERFGLIGRSIEESAPYHLLLSRLNADFVPGILITDEKSEEQMFKPSDIDLVSTVISMSQQMRAAAVQSEA